MAPTTRDRTFTTATGETLTVRVHEEVLHAEWSGRFFYKEISDLRAFEIQPRGHGLLILEHGSPTKVVDEWRADGGRYTIAHDPDTDRNLAIWTGPHHDLISWVMGPVPVRAQVARLYRAILWRDSPSGVLVAVRFPARGGTIEQQEYLLSTTDGAFISVRDPRSFGDMAPRATGARTQHGEVWKRTVRESDGRTASFYALATPTALSVYYARGSGPASARDLAVIDNLDVVWGG